MDNLVLLRSCMLIWIESIGWTAVFWLFEVFIVRGENGGGALCQAWNIGVRQGKTLVPCRIREVDAIGCDALFLPFVRCALEVRGKARLRGRRYIVLELVGDVAGHRHTPY